MNYSSENKSLWNSIKSTKKLEPSLVENIQSILIDSACQEGTNTTQKRKRKSKRVQRNVSTNLITLYRKTSKYRNIINPVYEQLGYDRKQKRFEKCRILLKDFLENLNNEIAKDNKSPGKFLKIKQENFQKSTPRKSARNIEKSKNRAKAVKEEIAQHDKTEVKAEAHYNQDTEGEKEAKVETFQVKEETKEVLEPLARNLQKLSPKITNLKTEIKNEDKGEMEVDSDSGEIDMTCKEELIATDKDVPPSPIRNRRSAFKDVSHIYTAEKPLKGNPLTGMNDGNNISMSCQRTRDLTNHCMDYPLNDKRIHLAKRSRDISSLKRNLADVFENISASGDQPKKDTIDEVSEFTDNIQIMKTPIKEEAKQSLLECISPRKHEGFSLNNSAFNSVMNTPMKPNYEDYKHLIPSFSDTKLAGPKKASIPQFMQIISNPKDSNFRGFPETFDSHQICEDICGKKRRSPSLFIMPPRGIYPDPRLRNSLIYSPCPDRYEEGYSQGSSHETPHLKEDSEVEKATELIKRQKDVIMIHNEDQEESESNNAVSEINPGTKNSRSERGLKRLSVKVRDLVFRLKETSYKDVANRLIEELVRDSEYDDSGRKLDQRSSSEKKTKDEKNVRRRVYDALNVLIASGVLRKNSNKNVMFEEHPQNRIKGLKLTVKKKHETKKKDIIKAINLRKIAINNKYIIKQEVEAKLNALNNLISRNQNKEEKERKNSRFIGQELTDKIHEDKRCSSSAKVYTEVVDKLKFPFLIVGTKNTKDNLVKVCMTPNNRGCAITVKEKFSLMGDMDVILKLRFDK
ncbi:unnamed protein product [Moneuplotes crassus]|uniref:E2F/DP family winged-helix DNA-binding domain-containing protein n=1 Tax=Euplotes crassus TaxID=5936 RepID=A0AAD2DAY0_EUPCR|nr:unnamed protein product [Moneuplotes crassus]